MIPQASIIGWSRQAPWPTGKQIEQDLILSRLIVEIANHPLLGSELAMRGGTCLHKLHLPVALRYSEDLDYVRRSDGPIGPSMDAIREVAVSTGLTERGRNQNWQMMNMVFSADSTSGEGPIRIKVEVNTREIRNCEGRVTMSLAVDSAWWTGGGDVPTFSIEELMGTKLRALYERRKGRDLFDLWLALAARGADPERILSCFKFYMGDLAFGFHDLGGNLRNKLSNREFREDLDQLVAEPPHAYNIDAAADLIMTDLGSRLEGAPALERIQQGRWRDGERR